MVNYINDDKAIYDLNKHRYLVTPSYIEETLGFSLSEVLDSDGDINPDTLPQRYIDFASLVLYTYIYTYNPNKGAMEYYISQPRFRDAIIDAQVQLIYAFILNNKPLGVYYNEETTSLVPPLVKEILATNGLLERANLVLPSGYQNGRGVDY